MTAGLHPNSLPAATAAAAAEPYALLAPHYDRILGHFRRPFEALRDRVLHDRLPAAFDPAANAGRVYADLGCGTGTAALQMAFRGWQAHGVDLAPGMLAVAREKCAQIGRTPLALMHWLAPADHRRLRGLSPARAQAALRRPLQADFQAADMRDFTLPRPADFLTCLFDSINHLPRHADLLPTLRAIRRNLAPGGLCLLDANSTRAVREVWPAMKPEVHQDDEAGYYTVLQGGPYDPVRKQASLTWTWFLRRAGGDWQRVAERYTEIAWTHAEWRQAIRRAGLKLLWLQDAAQLAPGFDPGWRHALLLTPAG